VGARIEALSERLKGGLTRLGARLGAEPLRRMNAAFNYLWVGHWMERHGFVTGRRVAKRTELYDLALADIGSKPALYLEFGVFRGKSLRHFARGLKHPQSALHGFDTFVGLPERWSTHERGGLSTEGEPPQVDDPRVQLFKGRFEEVLPGYRAPEHQALFVNVDSDLYSSAVTVLTHIEPLLRPGSYLYFDEFSDREHELGAFDQFLERTGSRFELVGATQSLVHVLFRRLA
jgi:hypothetical protein